MKRIAVLPAAELNRRQRLFEAITRVYPVEFVAGGQDVAPGSVEMAVVFGAVRDAPRVPTVCFADNSEYRLEQPRDVELAMTPTLERPLRGASIPDAGALAAPTLNPTAGEEVLGSLGGKALWSVDRSGLCPVHTVAIAPRELGEADSLRDRLREGEFLALLPLIHVLDKVVGRPWRNPPIRACFVIDDPNLHAKRYGYLDFAGVAQHATEVGYHLAVATVPFDQWLVSRGASQTFQSHSSALSLAIHGNDHTRAELGRQLSEERRVALLSTALRRMRALERRGLEVSRIMVAPHETCAPEMMRDMARVGFEGLCYGFGTRSRELLAGWQPADFVHGLPVLHRRPIASHRGVQSLNAFLGLPIVLAGHHDDLAHGLDVLAEAASFVNRLGDVQWLSLGSIGESNIETSEEETTLRVRLFSRRARVRLGEHVERIFVELPSSHRATREEVLIASTARSTRRRSLVETRMAELDVDGSSEMELSLERLDAVDPESASRWRTSPRAVVRRAATEARDRMSPKRPRAGIRGIRATRPLR